MIYQLSVPAAVPGVDEIRILEWQGAPGTVFETGDLIVELETHKAVVEVRAGRPGVLRRIVCKAGDWEKVGLPLALVGDDAGEPLPASPDALPAWLVDFEIT